MIDALLEHISGTSYIECNISGYNANVLRYSRCIEDTNEYFWGNINNTNFIIIKNNMDILYIIDPPKIEPEIVIVDAQDELIDWVDPLPPELEISEET